MTTPAFAEGMRVSGELSPGRVRLGTVTRTFPNGTIVVKWDALRVGATCYEDTYHRFDVRDMHIQPASERDK